MTITIGFSTVANSIAALSISGVKVLDIDEITTSGSMICPVLFPQPDNFVTNMAVERMSVGSGGTALMNMTYNLNYVYLHAEVGSGLSAFEIYTGLITNLALIIKTLLQNDNITGAVDMEVNDIGELGVITDPAGNNYFGVLFSLSILEFIQ